MERLGVILLLVVALGVVVSSLDGSCFEACPGGSCPDGCAHCSPLCACCCRPPALLLGAGASPGFNIVIASITDSQPPTPEPPLIEIWHVPRLAA